MKINQKVKRSLFSFGHFVVHFVFYLAVIAFCFLLFATLSGTTADDALFKKVMTAMTIIIMASATCVANEIYRKVTIEKPLKKILDATERVTEGDFSTQIQLSKNKGENEFDVIFENFNKMVKELGSTETLRSDFISNVSHEIKTPLAVIQNYTTLLKDENLTPKQSGEYLCAVNEATKNLSTLISNILKLNKLENQEIYPNLKKINLCENVCESLFYFEDEIERKGITLNADLDKEIIVETDSELLTLIWNNLISNALKFTDDGGTLTVSVDESNGKAVVTIRDNGCGMSQETGRRIFDKFYQGDTSRASQGNGLGLALVKKVIDIIGGEITVESKLGEGSTFSVGIYK